jgi:bacillopeptidase F
MPKSSPQITAFGNICRNETTPTPPAKPTGLVAAPSGLAIQLDWANNAESDFNIYTVLRSTNSGSGFQQLASRLKSSDYLDTNTVGGVTYYYQVKALDTCSSESVASTNASATAGVSVKPNPL